MFDSLRPHGLQYIRLPGPALFPGVCPDSCPLSQWCCLTISSSAAPFSSCPQAIPTWRSFSVNQLFTTGGQGIGASASVLPMNIQGWFPLRFTGLIFLQSKGLSRVFSSTTIWKYHSSAFSLPYGAVLTSIHDYWKNHNFDYMDRCWQSGEGL